VGFAVATAGVDNTIRADARFYWYLDLRVFQQYCRKPRIALMRLGAVARRVEVYLQPYV
jgi:hypothetical protein